MWTEEEAKAKWCPMARIPRENLGGAVNRDSHGATSKASCIASSCMSWRWVLTKEPLSRGQRSGAGMAYGLAVAMQPTTFERGYCGAFGEPSGRPPVAQSEENVA